MSQQEQTIESIIGMKLVDSQGDKVGKIQDVYMDDATGQPKWMSVNTGLFGTHVSFVPLEGVRIDGDNAVSQFDNDKIKNAPRCEADGHLEPNEEQSLYEYYGFGYNDYDETDMGETGGVGRDTSGPNTDNAMTRSEEEVSVSKSQREAGRARLRKYLVTEQRTMTVPVTHEEVRLEREPITDANRDAAMSGPDLSSEEHEVTLHEETVNVDKTVVPKERVRLAADQVTEERQVTADVTKEEIDLEEDVENRR